MEMETSARAAALISWSIQVRQGGPWDHKWIIEQRFNGRNPGGKQNWHLLDKTLYYYDTWSNIHYGFVGKAAGFSNSVLLDGAGLEQIGSSLLRFNWPQRDAATSGLRQWDAPEDRAGIEMGIAMYNNNRTTLTTRLLLDWVINSTRISKKPHPSGR
jgi:hypothetical protein